MGSATALRRDEYQAFARVLRGARETAGLSQEAVGRALGKSQHYVSECELGKRRVDVVEFADICRVLGCSPATILEGLASPASQPAAD